MEHPQALAMQCITWFTLGKFRSLNHYYDSYALGTSSKFINNYSYYQTENYSVNYFNEIAAYYLPNSNYEHGDILPGSLEYI